MFKDGYLLALVSVLLYIVSIHRKCSECFGKLTYWIFPAPPSCRCYYSPFTGQEIENLGNLPGVTEPVRLGFGCRLLAAHSGSSHYGTPPPPCFAKPEGLGSSPSPTASIVSSVQAGYSRALKENTLTGGVTW